MFLLYNIFENITNFLLNGACMEKITILIPVYNEVNTLDKILEKVEKIIEI